MKDTNYIDENDNRIPVSKMFIGDIKDCLHDGFAICDSDWDGNIEENYWIKLRLEIELIIRGKGLR